MTESTQELASRWQRLWGSLIDALIGVAVVFPAMWFFGVLQQMYRGGALSLEQRIVWFVSGTVVFIVIQGHLLGKYGQTIGKRMVGTRIISCEDGRILPFWTVFPLRYLPVSLVSQIPVAGQWLSLVDALFIFRKDKRCIHDLIAGTKVVKADSSSENHAETKDDEFYDEVAKELETNNLVSGVWTRAFAEADGDANRTKAIYIKLRVEALLSQKKKQRYEGVRVERERRQSEKKKNQRLVVKRLVFGSLTITLSLLACFFGLGAIGCFISGGRCEWGMPRLMSIIAHYVTSCSIARESAYFTGSVVGVIAFLLGIAAWNLNRTGKGGRAGSVR